MPTQLSYPLINGLRPDFASILWTLQGTSWPIGVPIGGFSSISYDARSNGGDVMGATRTSIGATLGQTTFSGSFEMYESEWAALEAALQGAAFLGIGGGVMGTMFGMTFTYRPPGITALKVDILQGVLIRGFSESHSQGGEALKVRADFSAVNVLLNGRGAYGALEDLTQYALTIT